MHQHLLNKGQDVVRRWVNEVQQAATNSSGMAQYHALGLLYHIKQKDRLAVQKLVATRMRSPTLSSPFAYCLLIRYASKVLEQDPEGSVSEEILAFLDRCLRHKNEVRCCLLGPNPHPLFFSSCPCSCWAVGPWVKNTAGMEERRKRGGGGGDGQPCRWWCLFKACMLLLHIGWLVFCRFAFRFSSVFSAGACVPD